MVTSWMRANEMDEITGKSISVKDNGEDNSAIVLTHGQISFKCIKVNESEQRCGKKRIQSQDCFLSVLYDKCYLFDQQN